MEGAGNRRVDVSVLVPAFNAEGTLEDCLESVRRQTLSGWECLVADDGSTDETAAIAGRFVERDDRFRLLRLGHRGIVPALNAGLEACRGRYVARMDADDLMHRHRLGLQAAALDADPDLDAVGCHVRLFPRTGIKKGTAAYERWVNSIDSAETVRAEAFVECPVVHPTLTVRAPLLQTFGYHDREWPEDYDLVLRLLEAGRRIDVLPRRLLLWRARAGRLSRTDARYGIDRFQRCKAFYLRRSFLRHAERYVLWGYGSTGREMRRVLLEHGRSPSFIVEIHPGRAGNTIHGAPVIPPEALDPAVFRPLLVSVAGEMPRREIREFLTKRGYLETRDFICVA